MENIKIRHCIGADTMSLRNAKIVKENIYSEEKDHE